MKKYYLFILFAFLLLPSFVSADWNDNVTNAFYFNSDGSNSVSGGSSLTATGVASITGISPIEGNGSALFTGSAGSYTGNNVSNMMSGDASFSVHYMVNRTTVGTALDLDYNYFTANNGLTSLLLSSTSWRVAPYGSPNDCTITAIAANAKHGYGFTRNASSDVWKFYIDGVNVCNKTLVVTMNFNSNSRLRIGSDGANHLAGKVDCLVIDPDSVWTDAEMAAAYNGGVCPELGPDVPTLDIRIQDIYDNANIEGLNVTLANGVSNLTEADGIAHFSNYSAQSFNVTDPSGLYFDYNSSSNPTENVTTTYKVYGAFVNLSAYDVGNNSVESFNVSGGVQTNTTSQYSLLMYLPPNATTEITVNGSGYISIPFNITTTAKDTGNYDITGLYQSVLTVYGIDYLGNLVQNQTSNVSGNGLNLSESTTNYNTTFYVLFGNYSGDFLGSGYSLQNTTFEIQEGNISPVLAYTVYAINSFYVYLFDEITEELITENMSVELINNLNATTFYTDNGTLFLEVLTPENYTIRYKSVSTNYTERDYYQTLSNLYAYNISLISLLNTQSTDLLVTVKDTSGDYVEGATVKVLRYYSSCNCYKVVEMNRASAAGKTFFIIDSYDGHYKFSVDYQGQNYFLSTSSENFVPEDDLVIQRLITLNLGSAYFESYRGLTDVGRMLVYNNETKALTFSWSDPADLVTQGCLYAEYLDGVHYTPITPACQNSSTGSVFLVLNQSNSSYKYYAELETSTTYSDYILFSGTIDKIRQNLLSDVKGGGFLGGILVVFLALIFSFSAIATILSVLISVVFFGFLGLFTVSTAFITGLSALIVGIAVYGMRR